jgi:thiamine pyrophosphate-dependent acetolactate synthase large subunit-like protein
MANDEQNMTRSLARAFDRAWDGYYRAVRLTVSQDVARTELARRLVHLAKQGIKDEESLAKAGLHYLRQLPLKGGQDDVQR